MRRGVAKEIIPYCPVLPNLGSREQTAASLAIDIHYVEMYLVERWDWERYVKLCNFLKMTAYEVASLVHLQHSNVPRYKAKNLLPLQRAHAVSVAHTLTVLEAYLMRGLTDDIIEQSFPNLNITTK